MRAIASLIVKSSVFNSEFVSQLMALEPDYSHNVGDPVSPRLYPNGPFRNEALWRIRSKLPRSAPLAEHMRSLIDVFDSRRGALSSIRDKSTQSFSCGLFGDYELVASFEITTDVIRWCSEVLEIALECFPCHSNTLEKEVEADEDSTVDDDPTDPMYDHQEPDRSFAYLASASKGPVPVAWPHETNDASSEQVLPRPSLASSEIVASDLPEGAEATQHIQRVLYLLQTKYAGVIPMAPELSCLFATERAAGSFVRLEVPILRQFAHLGASFRIGVYQTPSILGRLREFH
jgi:hypothetical protein